jgi:hypothetical protein
MGGVKEPGIFSGMETIIGKLRAKNMVVWQSVCGWWGLLVLHDQHG